MKTTKPKTMKPITIIVDTREQRPWEFDPATATTVRRALPAGDYSILGRESEIAVERKSLDDLVNTVIHSRDRWSVELSKLAVYPFAAVVVEGGMPDILAGRYNSKAHPNSVLGGLLSVMMDYGLSVFLAGDRPHAVHLVEKLFARWVAKHPKPGAAIVDVELLPVDLPPAELLPVEGGAR